jgi:hypothetical protein
MKFCSTVYKHVYFWEYSAIEDHREVRVKITYRLVNCNIADRHYTYEDLPSKQLWSLANLTVSWFDGKPSSAEAKNAWSCTSTPKYVSMVWCLMKKRDTSSWIRWTTEVRFPVGAGCFFFVTASKPVLGPTQPIIQWVPGAYSPGIKR